VIAGTAASRVLAPLSTVLKLAPSKIHGWVQGVNLAGAAFAASASWQVFIASVGSGLGESISSPLGRRATAALGALAIVALALRPLV